MLRKKKLIWKLCKLCGFSLRGSHMLVITCLLGLYLIYKHEGQLRSVYKADTKLIGV